MKQMESDPVRPADASAIADAVAVLESGGLVAFPTETVYGLGADATSNRAVAGIFAAKERPRFNPLIVHLPDLAAAEALARFDDRARRLARRFWPGALTLVLPGTLCIVHPGWAAYAFVLWGLTLGYFITRLLSVRVRFARNGAAEETACRWERWWAVS